MQLVAVDNAVADAARGHQPAWLSSASFSGQRSNVSQILYRSQILKVTKTGVVSPECRSFPGVDYEKLQSRTDRCYQLLREEIASSYFSKKKTPSSALNWFNLIEFVYNFKTLEDRY